MCRRQVIAVELQERVERDTLSMTLQPVHLWQGEMDRNAPPAMGRYLAAAIPQCRATFYPNEGHVLLIVNHAAEILRVLAVGRGADDEGQRG